jgi:hypothetical protein
MIGVERVRTGRLARTGSIFFLLLAVGACASAATPSPTAGPSSTRLATPSPIPTPSPSPSPTPTVSPRPMTPATMRPGPAMTQAREGQAAVRLKDGRVLIMGGSVPLTGKCAMACIEPPTASVEAYDPKTGKFSHDGSLAEARVGAQALLLRDGTVLVEGGGYGAPVATMEIFDPASGKSALVKLPADVGKLPTEAAISLLADGRVLIAGGTYDMNFSTSNATLVFDPVSGGFSDGPLMAKPRQGATATLLDDGRVLIAGGNHSEGYYGNANDSVEVISPSIPVSAAKLFTSAHFPSSSTLLSDGRVLISEWSASDSSASCVGLTPAQVFDPRTETFMTAGPMNVPRYLSTAIRIQDGRVIFLGGLDSNCAGVGRTVEAFDPDSGTFQVISTAFPEITGFSATPLDDGEILIAGGGGAAWNEMTAATWLLKP